MDYRSVLWTGSFLFAVGCGTDTDVTNRPLFDNGVNVFEAHVIDGQTGAPVTNATVAVQVGRHVIDASNDRGFYSVYGIPYGSFRIMATASGYNDFVAVKSFTNSSRYDSVTDGDPLVYYFNNIVMYPTGQVPADILVSVYNAEDGAPIPNATVAASMEQVTSLITITDALAPSVGLLPTTITAKTGADGMATVPAGSLIMGATYGIDVFGALDENGIYLVPETNRSVRVGYNVQKIVVFLNRAQLTPVAIMVNNEDEDLDSTLVVTFPYAVELCSTADNHYWTNTTNNHYGTDDTDGDMASATPAADDPVTHALTGNGTVLTLSFHTENDDAGDALFVTFSGVQVKPSGAGDVSCTSLTSVPLRHISYGGLTVDTEIEVRDLP